MKIQSTYLSHLIDELQQQGQYTFTKNQLLEKLISVSSHALARRIKRLAEKKRIAPLGSGFYLIVPTEYQSSGAPPAHWVVDAFMKHMKQSYYVSLLTATSLYGAAHARAREWRSRGLGPAVAGDFQESETSPENLSASVQSSERQSVVDVNSLRTVDGGSRNDCRVSRRCFGARDGRNTS